MVPVAPSSNQPLSKDDATYFRRHSRWCDRKEFQKWREERNLHTCEVCASKGTQCTFRATTRCLMCSRRCQRCSITETYRKELFMNWCQIDGDTYDMWEREWHPPKTRTKKAAPKVQANRKVRETADDSAERSKNSVRVVGDEAGGYEQNGSKIVDAEPPRFSPTPSQGRSQGGVAFRSLSDKSDEPSLSRTHQGPSDSSLQEHHNVGRAVIPPKTRNTPAKLTAGRLSCAQFSDPSEPAVSEFGDTDPDMPTTASWVPSPAKMTTHQTARSTQQPSLATSVDRAHFLSVATELESSQSLLAEKEGRVGELEEKIKEMEDEMDFFRDLLEWEKKKTKAMEETVAKNGHRDMDADMAERDINKEASDSGPLKQKVEALDGTMRKMERQVEELQGRLTKGGWNHSPSETKKNKEPSSSFPTQINESSLRSRTHDPRPTTSLAPSRNASATSLPPSFHGNAGQALGSLLLTEVAAWSSMSNLLQQATSTRDQVFAMHTQFQTPDAQKSSQVSERMLRLCQEREIFLFNLSGLFSSLYGPMLEDNVLSSWNPYANTPTGFTGGAGNHRWKTEPIPRDDDDDIDHEVGDFGLDARIRRLHAELEETEDLRMNMLLRLSRRTGNSRDHPSDLYEDDDLFRGAISTSQLRKRTFGEAFDVDNPIATRAFFSRRCENRPRRRRLGETVSGFRMLQ